MVMTRRASHLLLAVSLVSACKGTEMNDGAVAGPPGLTQGVEHDSADQVVVISGGGEKDETVASKGPEPEPEKPTVDESAPPTPKASPRPATEMDALKAIPTGAAQLKVVCARPGADKVRAVFCGATPPVIKSLADLQKALGIAFVAPTGNATGGNPGFAITGHSSSLVAKFTSSINPRVIVFTPPLAGRGQVAPDPNFVAMGFQRGEQFAEIIAQDPVTKVPAFFIISFQQACNGNGLDSGCSLGQLLTPAVEKDWTGFTVYEDTDLENTIFDCKMCHQPAGPTGPEIARMQERVNPWNHFFRNNRAGGQALLADFHAAHGTTEVYGGIPATAIVQSDPAILEAFIENNSFIQPNEFNSNTIEQQVIASSPNQPADNTVPGTSAAWTAIYNTFVAGNAIAPPYHDVKVSDATKLSKMTQSYTSVTSGATPVDKLPDIREVFLDSRKHEMGFGVQPGLDANGILLNGCKQCHNSTLNQNISRAKFNVDLSLMNRAEKDLAIERIGLPDSDPKRMPPERFRSLTESEKALLIDLLKK